MYNWYNPNPYWQNHWHNQGNNFNRHQMTYWYRRISMEEAMRIAQEQVPGQVVKVELDTENGLLVYEVDILTSQGIKYEVTVDVNTGGIVEIDLD